MEQLHAYKVKGSVEDLQRSTAQVGKIDGTVVIYELQTFVAF